MKENSTVSKIENLTDEELVHLSLENKEYFYYLIKRYEKKLQRYINRISDITISESEDILQDIFIKTYFNLNGFNQKLKFSSWIYRIAHNQIINYYHKNKSRLQKPHVYLSNIDISNLSHSIKNENHPYQDFVTREKVEKIRELLEKLPRKYREVLILRYLEGKKYTEISDILRKSPGTVATLINRAKSKFKKLIKNYWLKGEL